MASSPYAASSGQRALSPCSRSVHAEHIARERTELSASMVEDEAMNVTWEVLVTRERLFCACSLRLYAFVQTVGQHGRRSEGTREALIGELLTRFS